MTEQEVREIAETEGLGPIVDILLRGGPVKTNRFCLESAREIVEFIEVVEEDES